MSWTIAISNQKGGVGKTTTCISLGACLAELGNSTLIVDLDSQSNLSLAAGINPDELELAVSDILDEESDASPTDIAKIIKPTVIDNLDILPSDLRLAMTEQMLYNLPQYETRLKKALDPAQSKYAFILLDCPPALGTLTLSALTASNYVLVPVQCEYYSARGLMRLQDVVKAVQQHTNPDLDYLLAVTMYDKRNRISRQVLSQLQENLGDKFLSTIIGIDTKLRESAVVGEPIITYAPQSRASQFYRQLAVELITQINS